nr:hypothetical protein CFP56_60190 [Quercus suber]
MRYALRKKHEVVAPPENLAMNNRSGQSFMRRVAGIPIPPPAPPCWAPGLPGCPILFAPGMPIMAPASVAVRDERRVELVSQDERRDCSLVACGPFGRACSAFHLVPSAEPPSAFVGAFAAAIAVGAAWPSVESLHNIIVSKVDSPGSDEIGGIPIPPPAPPCWAPGLPGCPILFAPGMPIMAPACVT